MVNRHDATSCRSPISLQIVHLNRYGALMDQTELIAHVAKELGISNVQSRRLLKATLREIRNLLRAGHAVTLPHLGTFDTATYAEYRGYRPGSNDFALFPKRRVPVFRTGTLLREGVYNIEPDEGGTPT